MKIAVIGASGRIRRHQVTAIAGDTSRLRDLEGATAASADVLDPDSIKQAVAGHDAVVASVKGRPTGRFETVPKAACVLLDVLPRAGVRRLLFVGGGGSLEVAPGQRFVDAPQFPQQYKEEALAQADALAIFRASNAEVDWSYASPPPVHLLDGEKTGTTASRPAGRAASPSPTTPRRSSTSWRTAPPSGSVSLPPTRGEPHRCQETKTMSAFHVTAEAVSPTRILLRLPRPRAARRARRPHSRAGDHPPYGLWRFSLGRAAKLPRNPRAVGE